jgi:NAD(P)H-nitrite reductase large subunit
MPVERIVIVGAGPAGFATVRAYREHGGSGSVTLLGEEPLLPYERPPLTKDFLRGEQDARELAIEQEQWFADHDVQLRLGVKATAIDARHETVRLADGALLRTDAIVLATGSEPLRPGLPGMEHPLVMTIRTLPDSVDLLERARAGQSAIVIGTGFIGCEIAASLAARGVHVTLLGKETLPQLGRLGEEAARQIAGWLEDLDVTLRGGATVSAVRQGRTVELDDGSRISGSCVVLGMGVRPLGELGATAGLHMNDGTIVVDDTMRAPTPHGCVFAVGDVACAYNASAARHLRVEHWGDALEHGGIAGRGLAGAEAHWKGVPGFWSTIGAHTLKYAAWGDGYDERRVQVHSQGGFTVWYSLDGIAVGVLTHNRDEDYELGRKLIRAKEPAP